MLSREGKIMLKKFIKKVLCVSLTMVMLMSMVTSTSAATFTPKWSHTDAEVQERALYLIDKADDIAFSPYSGFSGNTEPNVSYSSRHKMDTYLAYAMCEMLLATPNLDSACSPETVAELKQAKKTWKSAYVSDLMYLFYSQVWSDTYFIVDTKYLTVTYKNPRAWHDYSASNTVLHLQPAKVLNKATSSYNRVKNYIAKYQKYNPTLAAKLNKWNTSQYKGYKKLASKLKTFTAKDYVKQRGYDYDGVLSYVWQYYKLPRLGVEMGQVYEETKILSKISTWYWNTKGMHPFNSNPNSPFNTFAKNVKYGAW